MGVAKASYIRDSTTALSRKIQGNIVLTQTLNLSRVYIGFTANQRLHVFDLKLKLGV